MRGGFAIIEKGGEVEWRFSGKTVRPARRDRFHDTHELLISLKSVFIA